MQIIVEHGHFRLMLVAYTPGAKAFLMDFSNNLPPGSTISNFSSVNWRLTLITPDYLSSNDFITSAVEPEMHQWIKLHRFWADEESSWRGASLITLDSGSSACQFTDFAQLIPRERNLKTERALLSKYLFHLKRLSLLSTGALIVHASAVARRTHGFLFTGPSGAGKTTIAHQSLGIADAVLHDDNVFIVHHNNHYSLLGSPNLNSKRSSWAWVDGEYGEYPKEGIPIDPSHEVPLTAIFTLVQDQSDYLVPLSSRSAAQALLAGCIDASGNLKSFPIDMKYAMHSLSKLARQVPGFELHFRKSPDFWIVIDEQFSA